MEKNEKTLRVKPFRDSVLFSNNRKIRDDKQGEIERNRLRSLLQSSVRCCSIIKPRVLRRWKQKTQRVRALTDNE